MSAEQRLLLALFLSMIVCAWWANRMAEQRREYLKRHPKQDKKQNKQLEKPQQPQVKPKDPQQPPLQKPKNKIETPKETPKIKLVDLKIGEAENEELITIETQNYYMLWSNRGAALRQLKFKNIYKGDVDKKQKGWQTNRENWLTVLPEFSQQFPSLLLFVEEKVTDASIYLSRAKWRVKKDLKATPPLLLFELGPINGITYTKKFTFPASKHFFSCEVRLHNGNDTPQQRKIKMGSGAGIVLEGSSYSYALYGYSLYSNSKGTPFYLDYSHGDLLEKKLEVPQKSEFLRWSAIVNKYFAYLLQVVPGEHNIPIVAKHTTTFSPDEQWLHKKLHEYKQQGKSANLQSLKNIYDNQVMAVLHSDAFTIPAKEDIGVKFHFYVGSKLQLSQLDTSFKNLDDYGVFGLVSHALIFILNIFFQMFHNYGIAIICLTLTIKICLFPLSRHQQISMQKYQKKIKKFQPQLQKLQAKYKNDRKRYQEEMMKLYKEHGVTLPVGGCLPMFLQLPIFIGLYQAIFYSLVLRQAGFLWITDLSQPDRLFHFDTPLFGIIENLNILPLVMTVVWLIQMKTAPTTEDPQMKQQQKIMMFMPIMFGFMFYSMPSGLVLYWLVMQLISVIEQIWIKKAHPVED